MDQMITLSQYLMQQLADHPEKRDIVLIMNDLATIGKFISRETNRAGLVGILGSAGLTNVQQEEVQKLDVLANTHCKEFLRRTGHFAALASEEEDGVVDMGDAGKEAAYVIAFDPLDGSSNIDVNVSIGTIFSVHRCREGIGRREENQFLQPGRTQVLAGYLLYGSSTVLLFSFGDGVHEFTLEPSLGEFLLSRERIMVPPECGIYSVNEGHYKKFREKDQHFIAHLKDGNRSARYIGSLVADIHRNLIKGGIYLYPAVNKGDDTYEGKLRLNFEAKPMAFLLEQAGGLALGGDKEILDMIPTSLHERTPLIIGNKQIVEEYRDF